MNNIWIAAGDGDLERVQYLVAHGDSVNAADERGYTPMHAAASYGHLELVAWLLSEGADIDVRDTDGDTPLHHCETAEAAQFLIARGADMNAVNKEGFTPAAQAQCDNNVELCALYGVEPESPPAVEPVPAAAMEDEAED